MAEVLGGDRQAAIGRELTKTFEEMRNGTLAALAEHYARRDPKGEVVICVGAAVPKRPTSRRTSIGCSCR